MVLMPRWNRELAGRWISQYRVTNWTNIPTMVIDLFASPNFRQFDLSSLSYIGGGGAAMPQAVAQRLPIDERTEPDALDDPVDRDHATRRHSWRGVYQPGTQSDSPTRSFARAASRSVVPF